MFTVRDEVKLVNTCLSTAGVQLVYVCVCACVRAGGRSCVCADMSPYCSVHDEWLIMKLCMYVEYHTANKVYNFGGDPVPQLNLNV